MAAYAAYHRDPVNKAIHFVFVPAIVWSLMVLLSLPPAFTMGGVEMRWSMLATAAVLVYYVLLDYGLGMATVVLFTVLEVTALQVAALPGQAPLGIGLAVFAGGFAAQFVGHGAFEHRRPALMDNALQVFTAPIFVVAEWAFALGWRKDLKREVDALVAAAP